MYAPVQQKPTMVQKRIKKNSPYPMIQDFVEKYFSHNSFNNNYLLHLPAPSYVGAVHLYRVK
jgi:hypothetical protein